MILVGVVLAALAATAAPPDSAPHPYVSGFCAPLAMSEQDTGTLRQHLAQWGARSEPESVAEAFRPQDADAPGQMVSFTDADAPHAFFDRRRGTCSLVYPGAKVPTAVLEDVAHPVSINGPNSAQTPWRQIVSKKVGPPGPIRYFLSASDAGTYGLCATVFEDVRLKDNSPAVLVRVETCRLSPNEIQSDG